MPFSIELSRSLFMITDPDVADDLLIEQVIAATRGGVSQVVLRRPSAPAVDLYRLAAELDARIRHEKLACQMIIHDRVDIALAVSAHGVHLPGHGLPVADARKLMTVSSVIGRSVHSLEEVRAACRDGADYVLFGHVYKTPSHPGAPGRGLDALRQVAAAVDVPVIAIGGITPDRVADVLTAGASGVAVMRAISEASEPGMAAQAFRVALGPRVDTHISQDKENT